MSNWSIKQQLREEILEAVEHGNMTKVEELLDKGADVNESEGGYLSKKTLLLLAIEKCNADMAKLLVDKGADITVTVTVTGKKKTIVEVARDRELHALVDYIEQKQAMNERLISYVYYGQHSEAEDAVRYGANVNVLYTPPEIDQPDCTLLQLALIRGHVDVAAVLIRHDIDLHRVMKWGDQTEDTARSYAERMNYAEIVSLIDGRLKEKPTDNAKSINGNYISLYNNNPKSQPKTVEVYDIEDLDEIQEETAAPLGPQKPKSGGNCTVS